jgi:hypothetical protein
MEGYECDCGALYVPQAIDSYVEAFGTEARDMLEKRICLDPGCRKDLRKVELPSNCPICGAECSKGYFREEGKIIGCHNCQEIPCPGCEHPIRKTWAGGKGSCEICRLYRICENSECQTPLTFDEDTCPSCGEKQPGTLAYFMRFLGAAALIFLALLITALLIRSCS